MADAEEVALTVVYTDGATSNNGRGNPRGGIGCFFGDGDRRNVSEPFTDSPTNQRCELAAIQRAIEVAAEPTKECAALLVKTDSRYSIGCLTNWVLAWERNGYLTSKGEPVKNAEIIRDIRRRMAEADFPIRFEYVKGHATGDSADAYGNRMADQLAVAGRGGDTTTTKADASPAAIQVELCHADARLPTRGTPQSAGWDLYSVDDCQIDPGRHACVDTGVKIAIPEGCYGRIAPRSGLAFRNQIDTLAGVVDRDYRDTLRVILQNLSAENPFRVRKGDRVAQLVVERICEWPLAQVASIDGATERGERGFGSTGR